MSTPTPTVAPAVIAAGSVPEGKVADYLTGRLVKDTPEEYVRQNIEKAIVRQYKYDPKADLPAGQKRYRNGGNWSCVVVASNHASYPVGGHKLSIPAAQLVRGTQFILPI